MTDLEPTGLVLRKLGPSSISGSDAGGHRSDGVAPIHWNQAQGSRQLPRGPLLCQVSTCGKDLLSEKTYYQRHRIW